MKNPNMMSHLKTLRQGQTGDNFSICALLYSMSSYIHDTYIIVLMAISQICSSNHVLKYGKLVNYLSL
jgi:hypothetical protein